MVLVLCWLTSPHDGDDDTDDSYDNECLFYRDKNKNGTLRCLHQAVTYTKLMMMTVICNVKSKIIHHLQLNADIYN